MTDKFAAATKAIEDAVTTAKKNAEGLFKTQQEQFEKASAQFLKTYGELTALAKGNVDALVKSSTIVAKGAEEAGKQIAAFSQSSLESSVADGKALFAIKSFQELVDVQSALAKKQFDAVVAETTKLQQLTAKVTNEALAPLSERVNLTVEKLTKPLAA